jgi:hypothetical protein
MGYSLSVRLQVYDVLNAKASTFSEIKVEEGEALTVDDVQSYFSSGLADSNGFSDDVTEVVALVSTLVNKVDCTVAPDCNGLGRANCSAISGTCGECLSGYVGDTAPSNDKCVFVGGNARRASVELFEECDINGYCGIASKNCPSDCSGNGKCIFASARNSNVTYANCTLVDLHCVAKCVCDEYFAGLACESTIADFNVMRETRSKLVQAIRNISLFDDATHESLTSWLQGLSDVCNSAEGLDDNTKSLISELAIEFMSAAESLGLPYEDISSVSKTLDLVLSSVGSGKSGAPADLLDAYAAFISTDMMEGQNSVVVTSSAYRLATYALDGLSNVTCETPQSALELTLGRSPQSVVVPGKNAVSPGYKFSMIELLVLTLDSHTFLSPPLGLRFGSEPCSGNDVNESCYILVTLQHFASEKQTISNTSLEREIYVECTMKIENITSSCPGGHDLTVLCNGTAGIFSQRCPIRSTSHVCQSIGRDMSECTVHSFTSTNITCECSIPSLLLTRKLQEDSDNSEVSVDFASAGMSILNEFTATWVSADGLSLAQVIGSWEVLLTIFLIAVVSIVSLLLAWWEDSKDEALRNIKSSVSSALKAKDGGRQSSLSLLADSKMRRQVIQGSSHNVTDVGQQHRGVDDALNAALPSVLQPVPIWVKYKAELKQYHRWAGIYFHYSKSYSRPLRLLSLLANVIIFIFVEALTYDLRDPDDGQCELEQSYEACLTEKSSLAAGESKCHWIEETNTCQIRDTADDLTQVLIVAMFAAMIGTPFAVAIQVLIRKYLAPVTIPRNPAVVPISHQDSQHQRNVLRRAISNFYSVSPTEYPPTEIHSSPSRRGVLFFGKSKSASSILPVHVSDVESERATQPISQGTSLSKSSFEELPLLFSELRQFRMTLNLHDRSVFDLAWGLENEAWDENAYKWHICKKLYSFGHYIRKVLVSQVKKTTSRSASLILLDNLKHVYSATQEELLFFDSKLVSSAQKNKRLMFLFVKDLLGSTNSKILESKEQRDNKKYPGVLRITKVFVWGIISIVLSGMLFYVYLFAMRQTAARQAAWFKTFLIWLLFEIVLVSFAIVFLTHVVIPSYVLNDLKRVREKVVADICAFKSSIEERTTERCSQVTKVGNNQIMCTTSDDEDLALVKKLESSHDFNAAKYLFVSNRIAKSYPRLPVSGTIISYKTHWPQQSLTEEKKLSDNYSTNFRFIGQAASKIVYFLLLSLISVPEPVQDCMIELVSSSGLGYCVVLLVKLYHLNAFIVAVPLVVIAISIHFIISSSKKSSLLSKDVVKSSNIPTKISPDHILKSSPLAISRDVPLTVDVVSCPRNGINDEISNVVSFCSDEGNEVGNATRDQSVDISLDLHEIPALSDDKLVIKREWDSDSEPDISATDTVLERYQEVYKDTVTAIEKFSISVMGEDPDSFDFAWEEESDEFKYFYKQNIVPFVDTSGCLVDEKQIIAKREELVHSIGKKLYDVNKERARKGIERRRQAALAWDAYRLYDSDMIFPFINISGKFVSEDSIKKLRSEHQILRKVRRSASANHPNSFQFSLNRLNRAKQLAEFNLLMYTEVANGRDLTV